MGGEGGKGREGKRGEAEGGTFSSRTLESKSAPMVKELFSLNASVMNDNHDTYKTANIKINQLLLNA
jgi:hypothetical protein